MGTFTAYYGNRKIREEDKEEFISRARTVMEQAGLMNIYWIQSNDIRIPLMTPPSTEPRYPDELLFYEYSYFERRRWEAGTLNLKTGKFCSNKVGWRHFCSAVHAVEVLQEFYTVHPGIATVNGDILSDTLVIGWLNQLCDENWTNRRMLTLLKLYLQDPNWQYLDEDETTRLLNATETMEIDANRELLRLLTNRERKVLTDLAVMEFPKGLSILCVLNLTKETLMEFKDGGGTPSALARVLARSIQKADREPEKAEDENKTVSYLQFLAGIVPVRLMRALIREVFRLEEDSPELEEVSAVLKTYEDGIILDSSGEFGLSEAGLRFYESLLRKALEEPVPKYSTAEFLGNSSFYYLNQKPYPDWDYVLRNEYRIPWWTPGGDISFPESLMEWMRKLRGRLDVLQSEVSGMSAYRTMQKMAQIASDAWNVFCSPILFRSTWEEFLENAERPEIKAAILLMDEILQECLADPEINQDKRSLPLYQYGSILANRELRKEQLGF